MKSARGGTPLRTLYLPMALLALMTVVNGAGARAGTDGSDIPVKARGSVTPRALADRFAEQFNVRDYGAKGDGKTDDSAAIAAAIAAAEKNRGGTVRFPAGNYLIVKGVEIAARFHRKLPKGARRSLLEVEGIALKGDSGEMGDAATTITYKPTEKGGKGAFRFVSAQWCRCEDIDFRAGNGNAAQLVELRAYDKPAFSTYFTRFERCGFWSSQQRNVSAALVKLSDSAHTVFRNCMWGGDNTSVQLGERMGVNPDTFGNGTVGLTSFEHCYISGDVHVHNAINTVFYKTEFGRKFGRKAHSLEPTEIIVQKGRTRCEDIAFLYCQNVSENTPKTGTFFAQGRGNRGLVVEGCRFDCYKLTFDIDGKGNASIRNNRFNHRSIPGTVGIRIGTGAENVIVQPNDFSKLEDGGYTAIDDRRKLPFKPFIVYRNLAKDLSFKADRTWEPVLAQSKVKFPGGWVRLTYAVTVDGGNGGTVEWRLRVKVNGVVQKSASTIRRQVGGGKKLQSIFHQCVVKAEATPAGASVVLEARTSGAGTGASVEATDKDCSTFMMMEMLP